MHFSFLLSVHLTTQILLCFQLSCWSFLLAFPRNIKDFYDVNLLLLASQFPQPLLKHGKWYTLLPHVQISVQPLKSYLSNCLYPASSRCVHYNYSHCLTSWCDVVLCCQSTSNKQGWGRENCMWRKKGEGHTAKWKVLWGQLVSSFHPRDSQACYPNYSNMQILFFFY